MRSFVSFVPLLVLLSIQDCISHYNVMPQIWFPYPNWYQFHYTGNVRFYPYRRYRYPFTDGLQPRGMPHPSVPPQFPVGNNVQDPDDKTIQTTQSNVEKSVTGNTDNGNGFQPTEKIRNPLQDYYPGLFVQGGSGHASGYNLNSSIGGSITTGQGGANGGTNHNNAGISILRID